MSLEWLFSWWNLIFVAPFAVALLYLGLYTLTGVGIGDADADAHGDFGADADADVDAAAHLEAEAHVDAEGHVATDGDSEAHGDSETSTSGSSSFHTMALSWLGVGRVPVTLIAIVLLLTWGAAGFVTNSVLRTRVGWNAVQISAPMALVISLFVTRVIVLFMGRFVPLNETYAKRLGELVGSIGEAVYGINENFGMVSVRDERGDLHQVSCRVAAGVPTVAKGAKVKLVAYGAKDRTFFVRQVETNQ
jgi:hypothetical protein